MSTTNQDAPPALNPLVYTESDLETAKDAMKDCNFVSSETKGCYAVRIALWIHYCRKHCNGDDKVNDARLGDYVEWMVTSGAAESITLWAHYCYKLCSERCGKGDDDDEKDKESDNEHGEESDGEHGEEYYKSCDCNHDVTESRLADYSEWMVSSGAAEGIIQGLPHIQNVLRMQLQGPMCYWRIQNDDRKDIPDPRRSTEFMSKWQEIVKRYPYERRPRRSETVYGALEATQQAGDMAGEQAHAS
ncbi:hypothetical protein H4S07_002571 [Coemansia furcata]|uniref:Uncharacterized protein n=1 Tax=Coemansia furcata TaxID=417177 RepID=A0ACC1LJP7_9FUNG|nr:hypothetical protein H4S07_002571 [Coemansia furcata]